MDRAPLRCSDYISLIRYHFCDQKSKYNKIFCWDQETDIALKTYLAITHDIPYEEGSMTPPDESPEEEGIIIFIQQ